MNGFRHVIAPVFCIATQFIAGSAHAQSVMQAPAGDRYVELDAGGESVLPNGRLITPEGDMMRVRPNPYGLAMSPDGRWVVAISSDWSVTAFDPFDREFNWSAMNGFVPMDDQEFLDSDAFGHSGAADHAPRSAEE